MASLRRVSQWLRHRAENIIALMLASMFATFLIQIIFRYALSLPLGWTVEYVTVAWLWGILFGYAFVIRDDDVIRLDLLYAAVPRPAQRVMDVASGLVVAGILAWSLPKTYEFVTFMKIEKTAYLQLRFDWLFAIYIPFILALIVRALIGVWHGLRGDAVHHTPIEKAGSVEDV